MANKRIYDFSRRDWDFWFQKFKLFYTKNNRYPTKEEDKQLANWIRHQQNDKSKGVLDDDKIQQLESLGFIWSKHKQKWDDMFGELQEYAKSNIYEPNDGELASWYKTQKRNLNHDKLRANRKRKIESLNFKGTPSKTKWIVQFEKLQAFRNANPNAWPDYDPENPKTSESKLAVFCQIVRKKYKDNNLDEFWFNRFLTIDFHFEVKEDKWYDMYHEIKKIIAGKETIHFNEIGQRNYDWIYRHNKYYDEGSHLTEPQRLLIQKLNLNKFFPTWHQRFDEVCLFLKKEDRFPTRKSNPELSSWLSSQRYRYKNGTLLDSQRVNLENIKFDLVGLGKEMNDLRWKEQFKKLKVFRKLHTDKWPREKGKQDEKELFNWCQAQRQAKAGTHSGGKRKFLEKWRIEKLDSIGFHWSLMELRDKSWNVNYNKVKTFINANKGMKIPRIINGKTNPIYTWKIYQKTAYNKGNYDNEKYLKLKMIGIDISK